ncbi:MAG: 3-phosphoserine/phosphohydroxythreonine transaminase [Oscillospiraceae bacterium]|nr:3-phosphoserine/phosphohydroxythreonine transaminase [Oscillospiraceae bacterium]
MSREKVYNFSAGPSVLPESALLKAQQELMDYKSCGMSVMEMSHRSKMFQDIFDGTKAKLKSALRVPDTHEILFLQGGATLQFAAIPMNLMVTGEASYAVTGNFSSLAAKEAEKYGRVFYACDTSDRGHSYIPAQEGIAVSPDSDYFYYCANNTIYGTEWQYIPETGKTLVCDMSSDILSRPVDVSKFGLIYAGAQKNMAPAGLTVVIIDKALAGKAMPITPNVMDYDVLIKKDSMLNTPPCWCIYMLGNTLDWLESIGGVKAMEGLKRERAGLVYDFLDESELFTAHAEKGSRSDMNITFRTGNEELDAEFVKEATARGMLNLKGHRIAGGMRASLYNAMPLEGVKTLVEFMKKFEAEHRCIK